MNNNVTYIFWQNGLGIHQFAFLRNLAEQHDVVLVVQEETLQSRIKHGWYIPDYGKVEIIVSPNQSQIDECLLIKNAIHIFSGIQSYKMPSAVFRFAIKRGLTVGVFSEPFNWLGLKGKLRFLKYLIYCIKYNKYISFLIVTGKRGRWCFEKTGFSKSKIFDFGYFTETPLLLDIKEKKRKPKLLFVGSIDERKNILTLIDVCKKLNLTDQLNIIGTGHLEAKLKEKIAETKCNYLGMVPNQEISSIIANSDVLILPSIFDGWGAVVNEALMCGTPVIASDRCGASILLQDIRGRIFSIEKSNLEQVLADFIKELPYNIEQRKKICTWALQNISGETASQYFVEIIKYIFHNKRQRPVAPWLK
ncbi:hypothetical protein FACS189438_0310 [Bacteroidia bacterium]|nr:hypothetical protein FACS189438_0310 [Bacteroidia bacterium]